MVMVFLDGKNKKYQDSVEVYEILKINSMQLIYKLDVLYYIKFSKISISGRF